MTDEPFGPEGPELKEKVRQWLRQHGYPFELAVGRQIRDLGFHGIEHGRFFRDPETKKWREIDIVATRLSKAILNPGESQSRLPNLGLRLVIECKHGSRPWVIVASKSNPQDNQFPSSFLLGRASSALLNQAELPEVYSGGQHGSGLALQALSFGDFKGHNAIQTSDLNRAGSSETETRGGYSQPNAAYSAVQSVVTAAGSVAGVTDRVADSESQYAEPLTGALVTLPVIVTNTRLFRLNLDDDGKDQLDEVQDIAIAAPPPGNRKGGVSLVRIVRSGEPLASLVNRAIEDVEHVAEILRRNWPEYCARAMQSLGLKTL